MACFRSGYAGHRANPAPDRDRARTGPGPRQVLMLTCWELGKIEHFWGLASYISLNSFGGLAKNTGGKIYPTCFGLPTPKKTNACHCCCFGVKTMVDSMACRKPCTSIGLGGLEISNLQLYSNPKEDYCFPLLLFRG